MTTAPRSNQILDQNNVPVQGASIYVYDLYGNLASLTSDGTTAIGNPLTTDQFGNYSYYATVNYYNEQVWFGGQQRWVNSNVAVGSPGSDLTLRTDLATSGGYALVNEMPAGAAGDGIANDTAAISTIDSVAAHKFLPGGTYLTTIAPTSLKGPFWGFGQIKDSNSNKRGPWFSAISSAPSSLGNDSSADTAFNGDLSHGQIAMEHRITGASTLGQPTTGYNYTNEAYPLFGYLYNASGWNQDTADNNGRTAACFSRVKVYHVGQGDGVAYNASVYVAGARSGATSFLASPAGVLFNGDAFAGAAGVYLNLYETNAHDQGYDVTCVGSVYNFDRNNNTGALGAWWGGVRFQSNGSKAIDNMLSGVGSFNGGIDFSMAMLSFGTNKAAAIFQAGHRLYGNGSSSNGFYATTLGNDWIERSSYGFWSFVFNSISALQVNDQKINCLVPIQSPNYVVASLPTAGTSLKGARAFATDLSGATFTFGASAVGGGSRGGPVFCDGSAWREG